MKKTLALCLVVSSGLHAHQNALHKLRKKPVIAHALAYQQEMLYGFSAGAASALMVDYVRNVMPSADSLQLYANYGICRDQLTGELKIASAVLGASALTQTNEKKYSPVVRVLAALVGANVAMALKTYVTK
ncbi:hypothetical protein Noda2021_01520 [Candidatus Dependentiae bacterium Noda2021]|nr:hypothetical protein Noda2021_01520 [Candidatus Dependentiae bacterium Noda2021]